jgi:hypothetical protein
MAKPVNENLKDVRVENENGDLIPLLEHAGEQFADLIKATTGFMLLYGKP